MNGADEVASCVSQLVHHLHDVTRMERIQPGDRLITEDEARHRNEIDPQRKPIIFSAGDAALLLIGDGGVHT